MDADYSHQPKDIPRAISAAKTGAGLAIGSRYCEGSRVIGWRLNRLLISRGANALASLLVRATIHDYTCGLRCYSTRLVKEMVPDLHDSLTYRVQIDTIQKAHKRGFNVEEFPMTYVSRKKGKSMLCQNEIKDFLSYLFLTLAAHSLASLIKSFSISGFRSKTASLATSFREKIDDVIIGKGITRLYESLRDILVSFSKKALK
jgi:hypothetical protein